MDSITYKKKTVYTWTCPACLRENEEEHNPDKGKTTSCKGCWTEYLVGREELSEED